MSKYQEIINVPELEIVALLHHHISTSAVLRMLKVTTEDPRIRKYINSIATKYNITRQYFRAKHRYSVEDVRVAAASAMCISDVLRLVGLQVAGNNDITVKTIIENHNIDISHFDINLARGRNKRRWSDEEIFIEHSPIPRSSLNAHVKRRNVLGPPVCIECGITDTYNNKPIKLTVDHINGISDDDRKENLRWLCHNCHSQTPTFGRKNRKNAGVA